MSQPVITTQRPSTPFWRRRSVVATAFVALLAAGVGAAVGALVASDSSVTYRSRSAPAPAAKAATPVATCARATALDGEHLLAVLAATPDGAARIAASLSPQTRQLIGDAVLAAAESSGYVPSASVTTMPDASTLVAVLGRLGVVDGQVILRVLPPVLQTEVGASLNAVAAFPTCP